MPGSTVAEGDAVTLYYGIDASGVKDAYTVHDSPETGGDNLLGVSGVAAGTWCNNSGDCITFKDGGDGSEGNSYIPYPKGRDGTEYGEYESHELLRCHPSSRTAPARKLTTCSPVTPARSNCSRDPV